MKEYIEKDAVLNLMNDLRNYKSLDFVDAIEIVEKQPAADVVEVVRCLECKFAEYMPGPMDYLCRRKGGFFHGRDFCSYGERKMNGDINRVDFDTVKKEVESDG